MNLHDAVEVVELLKDDQDFEDATHDGRPLVEVVRLDDALLEPEGELS